MANPQSFTFNERMEWNRVTKLDGLERQQLANKVRGLLREPLARLGVGLSDSIVPVAAGQESGVFSAVGIIRAGGGVTVQIDGRGRYNHKAVVKANGPAVAFPGVGDGDTIVIYVVLPATVVQDPACDAYVNAKAVTQGVAELLKGWLKLQGRNITVTVDLSAPAIDARTDVARSQLAGSYKANARYIVNDAQQRRQADGGGAAVVPCVMVMLPERIAPSDSSAARLEAKNAYQELGVTSQMMMPRIKADSEDTVLNLALGLNGHYRAYSEALGGTVSGQAFLLEHGTIEAGTAVLSIDVSRTLSASAVTRAMRCRAMMPLLIKISCR